MTDAPLKGLLVVSLEQAVAAPYCSSRLADAGARVIKIERDDGDFARRYDAVAHGESAYFVWVNRGKESLCLDIKQPTDQALLQRMLDRADVFIQNLAPGACERAGFAQAQLRARNPRLITVDISGYGSSGPAAEMKAYDLLVQCESGLAAITGAPQEPGRVGVSVCDIACGMYAHTAVLQALIQRGITGEGQHIQVSLFDAIADWMTVPLLHQDYANAPPQRLGLNHPSIAPYGAYRCLGGEQVVFSIQNEREWLSFCENVLQQSDIATRPEFRCNEQRTAHRAALDAVITQVFDALPRHAVIERLKEARIAYASLNSVADFSQHSQLRRIAIETPSGPVEIVAPPAQQSAFTPTPGPVPALNEHGDALRREFSEAATSERRQG